MFALDLFNTKYEKELKEGAVDSLEARRIDDLNMRMLELLDRSKEPAYKKCRVVKVQDGAAAAKADGKGDGKGDGKSAPKADAKK